MSAPSRPASRRPRPNLRRTLTALLLLVLVAAVVVRLARPTPEPVEVAIVAQRPMRVTVQADALTRVAERFTITAPVSGLVDRLALREGSPVRFGSVVATISTAPAHPTERAAALARLDAARALQRQAAARLDQAQAALAQARRDEPRTRELVAGGALAERDLERAVLETATRQADVDAARAQSRVATAELVEARAAVEGVTPGGARTVVRAPAGGAVLRIVDPSARVVAAGAPLLELGDPRTLEVAADVLSSDATAIRPGQAAELRGWGGGTLPGVVRRVEPSARTRISALGVEEQRLTVVIDLVDAPVVLGDGYRLDASIVVWQSARVSSVPASALLGAPGSWTVYRLEAGRAVRRPVDVGHLGGGRAEIVGGLAAGDTVVAFPPDALRNGARVRPVSTQE